MTSSLRFSWLQRLRGVVRFPVLTATEKTALVALALVLACGGALRWWERSGVRIGPVDDWEGLRALVIRAKNDLKTEEGQEVYPCLDEAPRSFARGTGGGRGGGAEASLLAAGVANARTKASQGGTRDEGKKPPARAVDLNTAGERALVALPGVGPSTARAILAHRAAHGRFRSVDDLLQVKGIGPKKLEALRPYIKVDIAPSPAEKPPEGLPSTPKNDLVPNTMRPETQ